MTSVADIVKAWKVPSLDRAGIFALDVLYPPVCVACDAPLAASDGVCASCWREMRPITAPFCPVLGIPFSVDMGADALSAEAIGDPPPYGRARAGFLYGGIAGKLVSKLKYGDRPELARFCAKTMVACAPDLLADNPVLVPVPLHWGRQWQRRYNQSTELSRQMAEMAGLESAPLLAKRVRRTRQQVGLSADQRARNVRGAFAINGAEAARLAGRRVVIIDDVVTTGATVKALTLALQQAGFEHIDVISFARVVIGVDMPI